MSRRAITDEVWIQLLATMAAHGCYDAKNSRDVMEAILWKLRTGAPWRYVPHDFCPWQTAFGRFNDWSKKGLWEKFFLSCEAKLIRNGFSSTEVTSALTSMRAELEEDPSELSDDLEEEILRKFIWPPMRMDIRSILKSLGVKFTMPKQTLPGVFLRTHFFARRVLRRTCLFLCGDQ